MRGRQAHKDKERSSRALLLARTTWSKKLTQDLAFADCLSALPGLEQADCSVHKSTPTRVSFQLPGESQADSDEKHNLVATATTAAHDWLNRAWLPEFSAFGSASFGTESSSVRPGPALVSCPIRSGTRCSLPIKDNLPQLVRRWGANLNTRCIA